MEKDAKILVLGANGLVGTALTRELLAQRYERVFTPNRETLDLLDAAQVRWYFSVYRPTHVFFAAARVGGIVSNIDYSLEFLRDNLQMELNVLTNAAEYSVEKLLFLGTSCCYPRECPQPMKPEHLWSGPLEPSTEAYSVAKLAGIKLCENYWAQGHKFITALPCNIFGERDNFDPRSAHCLPGMLARLHTAKTANAPSFDVWGSGKQRREFLYSADLACGLITAMERHEGPEPINIGSGLELTMQELVIVLAESIGYEGKIEFDTSRPEGTPRKLMDSTVLRQLGWQPRVDFSEAVGRTYRWFQRSILQVD